MIREERRCDRHRGLVITARVEQRAHSEDHCAIEDDAEQNNSLEDHPLDAPNERPGDRIEIRNVLTFVQNYLRSIVQDK